MVVVGEAAASMALASSCATQSDNHAARSIIRRCVAEGLPTCVVRSARTSASNRASRVRLSSFARTDGRLYGPIWRIPGY